MGLVLQAERLAQWLQRQPDPSPACGRGGVRERLAAQLEETLCWGRPHPGPLPPAGEGSGRLRGCRAMGLALRAERLARWLQRQPDPCPACGSSPPASPTQLKEIG